MREKSESKTRSATWLWGKKEEKKILKNKKVKVKMI